MNEGIGFRIQFFCQRCKIILSPNKLVEGCPKCQEELQKRRYGELGFDHENIDLLLV